MNCRTSQYVSAIVGLAVFASALTADVSSWRNGGNGLYPDTSAPLDWNDADNVLWKIDTPVRGNASPIIIGDKLLYTAEPAMLICVNANTGRELWRRANSLVDILEMPSSERLRYREIIQANEVLPDKLEPIDRRIYELNRRLRRDPSNEKLLDQLEKAEADKSRLIAQAGRIPDKLVNPRTYDANGYASLTPCSDGEYVYAGFGMGTLVKYDLDGNRIWGKVMEGPDHAFGASVSPQLVGGTLIVRFGDYAGIDPRSGEELWRVEDLVAFGTPASFQLEDEWYLFTVRGELIRVSDGEKLSSEDWEIPGENFSFFSTPFVQGNRVYTVHGASGMQGDAYCMEIPATRKALERNGLTEIWHAQVSKERYYASPVVSEGIMYVMSVNKRNFQALDAETGEEIYTERIRGMNGNPFTGIVLVNGKLLVSDEYGVAVFVEPGRSFKEFLRLDLGEVRSTPIFDGDTAYLRSSSYLAAFGIRQSEVVEEEN